MRVRIGTLQVVEEILENAKRPMSVREIITLAGTNLPTKSRHPANVVHRDLAMDIKEKQEHSKFIRTAPGRYALKQYANELLD